MRPPLRLLEDPSVPRELRIELRRASESPSPYQPAAGLAALRAAIGAGLAAPTAAAGPPTAATTAAVPSKVSLLAGSAIAKLSVGAALLGGVVAAGWSVARSQTAPPGQAPVTNAPVVQATMPTPSAQRTLVSNPDDSSKAQPVATPPASQGRPLSLPGRADVDLKLRREIEQLARIKAALDKDPARAFDLAEHTQRELRGGALEPEREALATLALAKMGRRTEAAARARRFLARYPGSPLGKRLAELTRPEQE